MDLGNGQVEARFTLLDDTNLDGTVDVTDLGNLASAYGTSGGAVWVQGDSNYDGNVDVTDLGNLASTYGAALASGPSASPTAVVADFGELGRAVPEPGVMSIVALIGTCSTLLRRRAGVMPSR